MKYIFLFLSASLLLASCTEDFFSQTVKIDPPEYDKQLSFHLLLDQKDSAIRIVVSRNYGILESPESFDDWFVKGATAELYENGQKWLTFTPLSVDSSFVLTAVLTHPLQPGGSTKYNPEPDFKFVVIEKFLSLENEFSLREGLLLNSYFFLKKLSQSDEKAFGLDKSDIVVEDVPMLVQPVQKMDFKRIP